MYQGKKVEKTYFPPTRISVSESAVSASVGEESERDTSSSPWSDSESIWKELEAESEGETSNSGARTEDITLLSLRKKLLIMMMDPLQMRSMERNLIASILLIHLSSFLFIKSSSAQTFPEKIPIGKCKLICMNISSLNINLVSILNDTFWMSKGEKVLEYEREKRERGRVRERKGERGERKK